MATTELPKFDYPERVDLVALPNVEVEIEKGGKVRINGKVAAFCRRIDIEMTVDRTDVILHRYRLKGDPPEERYWAD